MLVYPCPLVCPQQTRDADPAWSNAAHRLRRWSQSVSLCWESSVL